MTKHTPIIDTLRDAVSYAKEHPELHAEYLRRRRAGEGFEHGELVTAFMREFGRLNDLASRAACR